MPRGIFLAGCKTVVNTRVIMVTISSVSRWLPKDVITMPLSKIEAEISAIEKLPSSERSVRDVERLADLRDARKRIAGEPRGCH